MNGANQQRGISLIEMMIAMTLGLLLMAGVYSVYISTKQSSVMTEALASRQEAIRYVSSRISQDARMAGYRGCLPDDATTGSTTYSAINQSAYLNRFNRFVEGFDAQGSSWSPSLPTELATTSSGNDVLTIRTPIGAEVFLTAPITVAAITAAAPTTIDFTTAPTNPSGAFTANDIVLLSDCSGSSIFQVRAYNAATGVVRYSKTGLNIDNLRNLTPTPPAPALSPYSIGAQVSRIATLSYFIAPSASGSGPALWRAVNGTAEELAEGIERMQVQYGEDTNNDRVADTYRDADEFADTAAWRRVATVRVALLIASTGGRAGATDNRSFDLLGTSVGPFTDARLRRVVTLTFALRNRLP